MDRNTELTPTGQETHVSALEQAAAGPKDEGYLGNASRALVERILGVGIEGKGFFDSADEIAADALKGGTTREKAVGSIVRDHLALAAAGGFLTSVGGFVTLPVALPANVAGFYIIATRMVAAIAKVRGYDINDPKIRTAILLTLVSAEADDLLAKAGMVAPAGRLSSLAAQRLSGPALMVVNKAVGFRLLTLAGKKTLTRFGRKIPLIGGVVGAGMDGWLINAISGDARREFPELPLPPAA